VTGISMGAMQMQRVQIGNCSANTRSMAKFDCFDYFHILTDRQFPPTQIQTPCVNVLGDSSCTIALANYTTTAYALASSSTSLYLNISVPAHQTSHAYTKGNLILVSGVLYFCLVGGTSAGSAPSFNSTYGAITDDGSTVQFQSCGSTAAGTNPGFQGFPLGFCTVQSGQNINLIGSIKVQVISGGLVQFQLSRPLPLPVATGDTVTFTVGCNKSLATCGNFFNNSIHFKGDPYVPNPESAGV